MKSSLGQLCCVFVVFIAQCCVAFRVCNYTPDTLWEYSGFVVKGEVTDVLDVDIEPSEDLIPLSTYGGVIRQAKIRVDASYKTDMAITNLSVLFIDGFPGWSLLEKGNSYIVFVKETDGNLTIFYPYGGSLLTRSETPEDALKGLAGLVSQCEFSLSSTNQHVVVDSLKALCYLGTGKSVAAVKSVAAESTNAVVKGMANVFLLRQGDWSALVDTALFAESKALDSYRRRDRGTSLSTIVDDSLSITNAGAAPFISKALLLCREDSTRLTLLSSMTETGFSDDALPLLLRLLRSDDRDLSFDAFKVLANRCNMSITVKPEFLKRKKSIIQEIEKHLGVYKQPPN